MKSLKPFLVVSRANIQVASLPTASLGIALAARRWTEIVQFSVLLYVLLFFVLLTYSCQINCLNDLEVDKKYKIYLSSAVQSLGIQKLKRIIGVEIGLALGLIVTLAVSKNNWLYLLAIGGLVIGTVYSAPPLRIKKRGIFSPLPVFFGLYFLPIVAGWFIIRHRVSLFILLYGLGYALIMQGVTFVNMCEDSYEDKTSGIQTWVHVLGIRKTLLFGSICVLCGGLLTIYLYLSQRVRIHMIRMPVLPILLILLIFFIFSILSISKKLYLISRSADPFVFSKTEAALMTRWFLATRYPLLFLAVLSVG